MLGCQAPPATLVGSFICTFFAPHRQSIFVSAPFVKLTLRPPLFAFAASLLFHTIGKAMTLFICIVFLQRLLVFPVMLSGVFSLALFTPIGQSIFVSAIFAKPALCLPLFAFGAFFLSHTIDKAMALFIFIIIFRTHFVSTLNHLKNTQNHRFARFPSSSINHSTTDSLKRQL
jgi:hypothetical protein